MNREKSVSGSVLTEKGVQWCSPSGTNFNYWTGHQNIKICPLGRRFFFRNITNDYFGVYNASDILFGGCNGITRPPVGGLVIPVGGRLQNIKICPLCGRFFVFGNTFKQVWVFPKTKKPAGAGF